MYKCSECGFRTENPDTHCPECLAWDWKEINTKLNLKGSEKRCLKRRLEISQIV